MSSYLRRSIIAAVLLGTVAVSLSLNVRELLHNETFNLDGQVLYAAGRAWLSGANPYSYNALSGSVVGVSGVNLSGNVFAYPPQSGALCVLLGAIPYRAACFVWVLCQLVAAAVIIAITGLMLRARGSVDEDRWGPWILAAVVASSPFTSQVIWMGQTSLVAFAATLAAWWLAGERRWIAAGFCLGFASLKPQICILVAVWFMLERDWKTLLVAAVTAVALACYPMVSQGPIHTFVAWGAGASAYLNSTFNLPSWHHKIGLDSLLYAAGIPVSTGVWFALNILLTALLWRCREYIDQHDTLALLVAIMLVFSYSLHDYDLVSVPPLLAALWWYVRRSRVLICGALALVAMLFAPGRLLQAHTRVMAAVPALAQWRILVVAIMAAALVAFSVAKTSRRRASAAVVTSG